MATQATRAVGVDIGGTGIKAGIVDLEQGVLTSARVKVSTPAGAEPKDVLAAVREVLDRLEIADENVPLGVASPRS
jgi:Polyphosphate glucokinase (EC 2.7.1.63)